MQELAANRVTGRSTGGRLARAPACYTAEKTPERLSLSLFEFISVMISVLIALGLAQLLVSQGRLAQCRERVRGYLPHTLWNVAILLVGFLHWWSLWDFRDLEWNSAMFFYSLFGPLLLFFAVTILNPEVRTETEVIDLEKHYGTVRMLFLSTLFAALLVMTGDGPLFGTEPLFNSLRVTQAVFALCLVASMLSAQRHVQVLASATVVGLLVFATGVRFLPGMVAF